MSSPYPRLVIAGTGGDSGKTLVSLALLLAWRRRGLVTAAFKKGPDYIDRAWLAWACGMAARNLDAYMMKRNRLVESFCDAAGGAQVSVIEGNRGLHDGLDGAGTYSTAELAKLLGAPVLLLLDATKVTRTAAAMALGCQQLDPQCHVAGVILNRVAGPRHERVLRDSVRQVTGLPVLGVIRRQADLGSLLPDRHLGLVTPQENPNAEALEERLVSLAEQSLDLDQLLAVAEAAPPLQTSLATRDPSQLLELERGASVRLAYFSDSAFTFYYPENLAALERAGAELVPVSALTDDRLPEVDGLYIGGGFPETQAAALAANEGLKRAVREAAADELPIYAECGGLMYLSESFTWLGTTHVMAGVLPLKLAVEKRPQGHGYMEVEVDRDNPFFSRGTQLRGHEFHYSRVVESTEIATAYRVERGVGTGQDRDGLQKGNVLASYLHLHAIGSPSWAQGLVAAARRFRDCK